MNTNNQNGFDGMNVGLSNVDILKGTDIGVLRKKGTVDKSTYTRITKPDGTVVEKVKMNQKDTNKGLVDLQTDGVNFGDNGLNVGISKEVSEDVVSFVDSIWGSKQVAGKVQDSRAEKINLEKFKHEREKQLQEDSLKRNMALGNELSSDEIRRGL